MKNRKVSVPFLVGSLLSALGICFLAIGEAVASLESLLKYRILGAAFLLPGSLICLWVTRLLLAAVCVIVGALVAFHYREALPLPADILAGAVPFLGCILALFGAFLFLQRMHLFFQVLLVGSVGLFVFG